MTFKEISFADNNAKRIYIDYINRVKHAVKDLNKANQTDTLLEINSHIYEALSGSDKKEVEAILNVLEKLGQPEVFLKELVAEKKLEEATQSFNPIKIIKALILNLSNGISYVLFLVLYLSLFSFVFLIFAKFIYPQAVGFFYKANDFFILGMGRSSHIDYQAYEQLGHWFIPVMIVCATVLFVLITLLLKLKKLINSN